MALDRREMGDRHEKHIAAVNGGRQSRSSGNQWFDSGDGRNQHDERYAWGWDCKSTRGKSLTITLEMIGKITEQAGGERPQIPLRWYLTDDLAEFTDWVALPLADYAEMLADARGFAEAMDRVQQLEEEIRQLREQAAPPDGPPPLLLPSAFKDSYEGAVIDVPQLPWTVVFKQNNAPGTNPPAVLTGFYYAPDGRRANFPVSVVRVEVNGDGSPRVIINEQLVKNCDLYVNGSLSVRSTEH